MRATLMFGAKDVQVHAVADATITDPTDALVRVMRSCICGSDLWPYREPERRAQGQRIGHEAIGVVEGSIPVTSVTLCRPPPLDLGRAVAMALAAVIQVN